jgi:AraC family transcriptional regulator of adaptative response/methylated-DNA-[protein]-cysteine methyltransferase
MNDAERWAAVLARERSPRFFYGVVTTGVYCRPSCPARRPRRDNVAFFDSCDDAERAGYRPCRRCVPRAPHPALHLVADVCRYIDAHDDRRVTLAELAEFSGLSAFHLQRTFKAELGVSPREYSEARRRRTMPEPAKTMETICYAISDSPIGRMLVAESSRGICAVSFEDGKTDLLAWMRQQFPRADLVRCELPNAVAALLRAINGDTVELPLDIRATAFQQKVWRQLKMIPRGRTCTYEELAAAIGQPSAVRAAAHACAANRIAVAVPCHRVVRKDGGLGGYRWGIERKRRLLDLER